VLKLLHPEQTAAEECLQQSRHQHVYHRPHTEMDESERLLDENVIFALKRRYGSTNQVCFQAHVMTNPFNPELVAKPLLYTFPPLV
jgi:hypothetical protein